MRFRTGVLSLAVLALAALPVAAETAPTDRTPIAVRITPDGSGILTSTLTSTTEQIMSWGKTANGTAPDVKQQVSKFANEVAEVDKTYASESVASEHQRQVQLAEAGIAALVDAHPDGTAFSVSVSGSVNQGGLAKANGGYVTIGYSITSTPDAAPESTPDAAPALGRAESASS